MPLQPAKEPFGGKDEAKPSTLRSLETASSVGNQGLWIGQPVLVLKLQRYYSLNFRQLYHQKQLSQAQKGLRTNVIKLSQRVAVCAVLNITNLAPESQREKFCQCSSKQVLHTASSSSVLPAGPSRTAQEASSDGISSALRQLWHCRLRGELLGSFQEQERGFH